MTDKQIKLIKFYCKQAQLNYEEVIDWVKQGKCSISEITSGILGKPA